MQPEIIHSKILEIRTQRVMLDKDLAALYEVETRALKQAVRRNIDRFPEDFMFEMTDEEVNTMVSQNVIPSKSYLGGALPYAFTEQGVAMLSSVLKSKKALQVNIAIMRVFVEVRRIVLKSNSVMEQIEILKNRIEEHDVQLHSIYDVMENLLDKQVDHTSSTSDCTERERIGFKKKNY